MNMDAILRSLQDPLAAGFEGPRPPEFYDARAELAGDDLGLDMLRRGYQPVPRETFTPERREDFRLGPMTVPGASIDALIAQLAGDVSRMPARNFGQGLARGFVRGAIAPQVQGMRDREDRNVEGRQRIAGVNREAEGRQDELRRAAVRMAMEGRAKRLADARRPMVPVSATLAQALGRDDLIGKSVPEQEWQQLDRDFQNWIQYGAVKRAEREANRRGQEKADPWEGMSARDRYLLENFDKRTAQIENRIDDWRRKRADAEGDALKRGSIPAIDAQIEELTGALARIQAQREALMGGGDLSTESVDAAQQRLSPPAPTESTAAAPADTSETRKEIAALKREAKQRQGELTAKGALSAQRKAQAQSRLNAIQKRLMELGDPGLTVLPNEQSIGVAAPRKPAGSTSVSPTGGPSPGASSLAPVLRSVLDKVGPNPTKAAVKEYLKQPGVIQIIRQHGANPDDLLRTLPN